MPSRVPAALLIAAAPFAGCNDLSASATARDTFAAQFSCPADRVTATERGPEPRPAPPDDIARDPARLEMWKGALPPAGRLFEASGCDHRASYVCRHGSGRKYETGTLQYTCAPSPS